MSRSFEKMEASAFEFEDFYDDEFDTIEREDSMADEKLEWSDETHFGGDSRVSSIVARWEDVVLAVMRFDLDGQISFICGIRTIDNRLLMENAECDSWEHGKSILGEVLPQIMKIHEQVMKIQEINPQS